MVSDQQMSAWPADNPERRSIESLIPYAGNPMTHPPAQIELLKRSLREFGWTMPVLVDEDGGIIAGHGRVMAAMQLGIKIVPCLVAKGWPEARKRAWIALGIQSELGRGENLLKFSDSVALDGQAYNQRFKGQAKAVPVSALGGEV